jgi:hypothetical protein
MRIALLIGAVMMAAATAAAAGSGSGVRVAKNGVGAYIGNHYGGMPPYVVTVQAKTRGLLEISMHPFTTCYPTYELLNGKKVKLTPAQQKSFAEDHAWDIGIPDVALSGSGSFHKSETVPGPDGSHPSITGQVSGTRVSGTFSATGIVNNGSNQCDSVHFAWTATYNATATPNPGLFQVHP